MKWFTSTCFHELNYFSSMTATLIVMYSARVCVCMCVHAQVQHVYVVVAPTLCGCCQR